MRACCQCMERQLSAKFLQTAYNLWYWHAIHGKGTIDIKNRVLKLDCLPVGNFYPYHLFLPSTQCFFAINLPYYIPSLFIRQTDGRRTFKLLEGEPLQTSYGEDLYH